MMEIVSPVLFCYSELKRRLKADKKAKEKAEKCAAAAAAVSTTTANSEPSLSSKELEDIDPNVSHLSYVFGFFLHGEGRNKRGRQRDTTSVRHVNMSP